jgi:hypothetical protein
MVVLGLFLGYAFIAVCEALLPRCAGRATPAARRTGHYCEALPLAH